MRKREGHGQRNGHGGGGCRRLSARGPLRGVLHTHGVAVAGGQLRLRGVAGGAAPVQDASHAAPHAAPHVPQRETLLQLVFGGARHAARLGAGRRSD